MRPPKPEGGSGTEAKRSGAENRLYRRQNIVGDVTAYQGCNCVMKDITNMVVPMNEVSLATSFDNGRNIGDLNDAGPHACCTDTECLPPHRRRPRTQVILIGVCGGTSYIRPRKGKWSWLRSRPVRRANSLIVGNGCSSARRLRRGVLANGGVEPERRSGGG